METSSVKLKASRYVWGGNTDVFPRRLGWWERRVIPYSDSDAIITLTPEYDRRPDLLAYDLYGRDGYSTLILQFNAILDINTEFVTGVELRIPSRSRVDYDIVNRSTGGVIPKPDQITKPK